MGQTTTKVLDIQGHRGCRGLMPENTIPAFRKALDLGVTTLELDVVISNDQQVVVSHEPYFNADITTAPDGTPVSRQNQKELNIYRMDYNDVKRYDVGLRGNVNYPEQQKQAAYKPLLKEVFDSMEAYRKTNNLPEFGYNIEIKSEPDQYGISQPAPAAFSDLVLAIIKEHISPDRITIQSFDFAVLKHWKQQIDAGKYPKIKLAALVADLKSVDTHLKDLGFIPDIYSPYFRLLGQEKVNRIHQKGMKVIPWTVNNAGEMQKLKGWGVDGIITDYPDRAKGL
ncbi:glycerophosphodiester phosphodiesterase family protein [Arsenicibacter rosenii]|uniref:Glycerophosphodiester phosphodiesterase n=1 Tax=Arsenicibacter rosenii TaxID=1750698 RepID=A0A1S2VK36_9BACT|nr:glycerophosphodiester phosphodiesterase family protein [Arsenicibacter rosenii]OIN59119.1 glycerophosphodiester phosphodiesterase [Arsenicibacter rosenii]